MDRAASDTPMPEAASLSEQGDREFQQDAVRTTVNADGSWMIAVADGTGGGINTEDVAPAAVGALPERIVSDEEMIEAFAAANEAARRCGTDESQARMDEDLYAGCSRDPDTTLVVAAWTPEGGLIIGWVGDSVAMVVPDYGDGWCCMPQVLQAGNPLIGEFAVGGSPSDSLRNTISLLSEDLPRDVTDEMVAAGALVVVMSDGAYDDRREPESGLFRSRRLWEDWKLHSKWDDRRKWDIHADAALLDEFLPPADRTTAAAAANSLMERTRRHPNGMYDNTSVAAVRFAATTGVGVGDDWTEPEMIHPGGENPYLDDSGLRFIAPIPDSDETRKVAVFRR